MALAVFVTLCGTASALAQESSVVAPVFQSSLPPGERPPLLQAGTTIALHAAPDPESPVIAGRQIMKGESIIFDQSRYQTLAPGELVITQPLRVHGHSYGPVDFVSGASTTTRKTISLAEGDVLEYLQYRSEGFCLVRFAGEVLEIPEPDASHATVRRKAENRWWVRVLGGAGQEIGWTIFDSSAVVRADYRSPLENRVTVRMPEGSFRSFLDEISRQTKLRFHVVGDLEKCSVSAFLRNLTARQILQATLEVGGLTYQQLGRSDTYTIAPRGEGPRCGSVRPKREAKGRCQAADSEPISVKCKNGRLAEFTEIMFDQSKASFFLWDGAADQPLTLHLKRENLGDAIERLMAEDELRVRQLRATDIYVVTLQKP